MTAVRRILALILLTVAVIVGASFLAYLRNGTVSVVGETNASTRSLSTTADVSYLAYQPRGTVMTLTSYGRTAESAKSGIITC